MKSNNKATSAFSMRTGYHPPDQRLMAFMHAVKNTNGSDGVC
jgi:hypothetical protein